MYLPFPCSDTSWELTSMESKGNLNKHHKNSEIDSFERWHIKKTPQIGLWSYCRCCVGQYICAFVILTVFVLSHAISTQHHETFHPASPLFFLKLSTQHQPAITRIENWSILPTQIPRAELVTMFDAGWNSTRITVWGVILLRYYFPRVCWGRFDSRD